MKRSVVVSALTAIVSAAAPGYWVGRDDLFVLAERTGSYVYKVPDNKEMMRVAKVLSTAIRSPYELYFNQPPSAGAPRQGSIRMKLNGVPARPARLYPRTISYRPDGQ
jgi:hypothetical protein